MFFLPAYSMERIVSDYIMHKYEKIWLQGSILPVKPLQLQPPQRRKRDKSESTADP